MKIQILAIAILSVTISEAMSQSNPNSSGAVDTEAELSWPNGQIYVNSVHENIKSFERPDVTGTQTGYTNIVNWDELSGGTGEHHVHTTNPYHLQFDDLYNWNGGRWPEFGNGIATSLPSETTNTVAAPEMVTVNGSLFYGTSDYSESRYISWFGDNDDINIHYSEQQTLLMTTGGNPASNGNQLYEFLGAAETVYYLAFPPQDYFNPEFQVNSFISPSRIQIGNLGNLTVAYTNNGIPVGTLWATLPAHIEVPVTPKVIGSQYSDINVSVQPYQPVSQCVATTPTDRARTTLGVGEQVALSFIPALPTNATWTTTAGSVSPITNISTLFTAPSNAANVTVTASVYGKSVSMNFKVVEPNGIVRAQIVGTNSYPLGQIGAGMTNKIWIVPTNVSFYRVKLTELQTYPINITGYYTNVNFGPVQVGSATLGYDNSEIDWVFSGAITPAFPIYSGGYELYVTNYWRVEGSSVSNFFAIFPSSVRLLNSIGDESISKYGITLTRSTNDVSYSTQ